MDAVESLLARVAALGGRVVLDGGSPRVVPSAGQFQRDRLVAMAPELAEFRAELVAYLQAMADADAAHPGRHCPECSAWVYTDNPAVGGLCGMLMCPAWTPELGPEGKAEARRSEQWRRENPRPGRSGR